MVECEYQFQRKNGANDHVLIDTWWNVNNGINSMGLQVQSVLIDTWWNVN